MTCFLKDFSEEKCSGGKLIRAHLIGQNFLKRELGKREGERAARDERSWVYGCGGSFGIAGHHHEFDHQGLVIPLERLPDTFLAFLNDYGLDWYAPKHFPKESALCR